jgi:hypothetical protein
LIANALNDPALLSSLASAPKAPDEGQDKPADAAAQDKTNGCRYMLTPYGSSWPARQRNTKRL